MSSAPEKPPASSRAWLEAGVAVLLAAVVDRGAHAVDLPGLAYLGHGLAALVVALRHGFTPAAVVAVFVSAFHGYRTIGADTAAAVAQIGVLLAVPAAGMVVDRLRLRVARLQRIIASMRPPDAVSRRTTSVEKRPRTDNLPRLLYRYARLLNVTDEKAIYNGLAIVVAEALPATAVAVFGVGGRGLRHLAGDPLPPPRLDPDDMDASVVDDGSDHVNAWVRNGVGGDPAAVLVVSEPGRGGDRQRALDLLRTFIEWASAGVGHARALQELDDASIAESTRLAEARGRASAVRFARTGRIEFDFPSGSGGGRARAPRPERPAIAAVGRRAAPADLGPAILPPHEATTEDDTEQIDSGVVQIARSQDALSAPPPPVGPRIQGPPSLLVGAARASMKIESIEPRRRGVPLATSAPPTEIDPPGAALMYPGPLRERLDTAVTEIANPETTPAPPVGRPAPTGSVPLSTADDSSVDSLLSAELDSLSIERELSARSPTSSDGIELAPEVRAAIERMAGRLADRKARTPELEEAVFDGFDPTDMEAMGLPAIDEDMVPADELPLIGGASFGIGIAREVGRSAVDDKFAHLLANLSEHLDRED